MNCVIPLKSLSDLTLIENAVELHEKGLLQEIVAMVIGPANAKPLLIAALARGATRGIFIECAVDDVQTVSDPLNQSKIVEAICKQENASQTLPKEIFCEHPQHPIRYLSIAEIMITPTKPIQNIPLNTLELSFQKPTNTLQQKNARSVALKTITDLVDIIENVLNQLDSEVIVSGGGGFLNNKHTQTEGQSLLLKLAEALGASIGCTRALVDEKWFLETTKVGQSGTHVAPKLYLALGISGAIQHLSGMQHSECIIAIDINPDAPIFAVAHYYMVGDLFDIVPALLKELARRNSKTSVE